MPNLTTNFSYSKPLVNDATDEDLWGGYLNTNLDSQDGDIYTAQRAVTLAKTTTYTTVAADKNKLITGDATGASFSITLLPAATAGSGFVHRFKKIDSSANTVTIDANAAETIDGALTFVLSSQYDYVTLVSNGSNWLVVAKTSSAAHVPTVQKLTAGSAATYTTPANVRFLKITMVAGGGAGGSDAGGTPQAGGNGGNSIFNSINAAGGIGGNSGTGSPTGGGGRGTTPGTGSADVRVLGTDGAGATRGGGAFPGGMGGSSHFGGAGQAGQGAAAGSAARANSGSGGGGAGTNTIIGGGGGQAGELVILYITSPAATYTYTIGAAGAAPTTGANNGGAGGSGYILVEEFY